MNSSKLYRVRFRFRLEKKLNIKAKDYQFEIASHLVTLSPELPDINIRDSEWLIMNAKDFTDKKEARDFSDKLRSACEVSSVSARLGIDIGKGLATSGFGKLVKERAKEQTGIILRDNIHGVDVFEDDLNIRFLNFHATGTVLSPYNPFLSDLARLYEEVENISQTTKDIVLLLNYALMRPDPVAKIVFSFSAVEMLGQNESWNNNQKSLIKVLACLARENKIGTENEREEVAMAIEKGLHKLSLRQGVFRLLSSLHLEHLKKDWDKLYSKRSSLVHGLAPKLGVDYSDLAHKSVGLCGQILLSAISQEIPSVNNHIDKLYKP